MRYMAFAHPYHNQADSVSVRFGDKWADLRPGEYFLLTKVPATPDDERGEVVGKAVCHSITICRLCDVPKKLLYKEHDPRAQDRAGLHAVLAQVYPGIQQNDTVVVVRYTVLAISKELKSEFSWKDDSRSIVKE